MTPPSARCGFRRRIAAVSLVGWMAVGCAAHVTGDPEVNNSPTIVEQKTVGAAVDISILEAGGHADYLIFSSPEELAARSAAVVVGKIDGFADGHTVLEYESGFDFPDIRLRNVVVRVKIDQILKAEGIAFADGFAYLSLPRGAEVIKSDGTADRPSDAPGTITPVAAFAEALPVGTRVVVMSHPFEFPADRASQVVERDRGRPGGSTLLFGGHPQLMSVEYGAADSKVTGWRDLTFKELTQRAAAALAP